MGDQIIKNLDQALFALKSSDPKVRMEAAIMAVEKAFWFSDPPEWFSSIYYPDVVGFDDKFVLFGTSFKNIRKVSWEKIKNKEVYEEFVVDQIFIKEDKKIA